MTKYAIKNPTTRKVRNRGWVPAKTWINGWRHGWVIGEGRKWTRMYVICEGRVKRLNPRDIVTMEA